MYSIANFKNFDGCLKMQKKIILFLATLVVAFVLCGAASAAAQNKTDNLYSPKIKSIDPANNSNNVPTTKLIKVSFTRLIYQPNSKLIKLETYNGKVMVPITYTIRYNEMYIDHVPLKNQRTYLLTIKSNFVKDKSGNGSVSYLFTFKTGTTNLNSFNAKLVIPRMNANITIRSDTMNAINVVYHYPNSVYFGTPGECATIGHRTTRGGPMYYIHTMRKGDLIYIYDYTAMKKCVYRTQYYKILNNENVPTSFAQQGASVIQLRTCNPIGQSYQKYLLYGTLAYTLPL